ncbi:MAG: uracil phosphoribosyltransferase [Magnetovibrionaceae bacterium]
MLTVLDHPLIGHKLTLLRDAATPTAIFRQVVREIALLMGYEATRTFQTEQVPVSTPVTDCLAPRLAGKKVAIVPILRAGTAMADGLIDLMPSARVGSIGLYRDEDTKQPVEYLVKLPDVEGRQFLVVDPMLATGHSAAYAVQILRTRGVPAKNIQFLCLLAAPEGVDAFAKAHPDVRVFAAALDERLNEKAYIVPGLGDAGDRIYGTK